MYSSRKLRERESDQGNKQICESGFGVGPREQGFPQIRIVPVPVCGFRGSPHCPPLCWEHYLGRLTADDVRFCGQASVNQLVHPKHLLSRAGLQTTMVKLLGGAFQIPSSFFLASIRKMQTICREIVSGRVSRDFAFNSPSIHETWRKRLYLCFLRISAWYQQGRFSHACGVAIQPPHEAPCAAAVHPWYPPPSPSMHCSFLDPPACLSGATQTPRQMQLSISLQGTRKEP